MVSAKNLHVTAAINKFSSGKVMQKQSQQIMSKNSRSRLQSMPDGNKVAQTAAKKHQVIHSSVPMTTTHNSKVHLKRRKHHSTAYHLKTLTLVNESESAFKSLVKSQQGKQGGMVSVSVENLQNF